MSFKEREKLLLQQVTIVPAKHNRLQRKARTQFILAGQDRPLYLRQEQMPSFLQYLPHLKNGVTLLVPISKIDKAALRDDVIKSKCAYLVRDRSDITFERCHWALH